MAELVITRPVHVNGFDVKLDKQLLQSLVEHRRNLGAEDWGRWQNAITCFNAANTDDPLTLPQVEWTLLASAFERILDARSKNKDVADRFQKGTKCQKEVSASTSRRNPGTWTKDRRPLRFEWMCEFYRVRGDFAHGNLDSKRPLCWKPPEHLLLAKIAFPLLVRCLLKEANRYSLTDDDLSQLQAFERLADGDIFSAGINRSGLDEWPWQKLLAEGRIDARKRRLKPRLDEFYARHCGLEGEGATNDNG